MCDEQCDEPRRTDAATFGRWCKRPFQGAGCTMDPGQLYAQLGRFQERARALTAGMTAPKAATDQASGCIADLLQAIEELTLELAAGGAATPRRNKRGTPLSILQSTGDWHAAFRYESTHAVMCSDHMSCSDVRSTAMTRWSRLLGPDNPATPAANQLLELRHLVTAAESQDSCQAWEALEDWCAAHMAYPVLIAHVRLRHGRARLACGALQQAHQVSCSTACFIIICSPLLQAPLTTYMDTTCTAAVGRLPPRVEPCPATGLLVATGPMPDGSASA